MNRQTIIFFMIMIIILILVILTLIWSYNLYTKTYIKNNVERMSAEEGDEKIPYEALYTSPGLIQRYDYANWNNYIKAYDYRKAFDPFEEPVRRVPRHELPLYYFKNMIDYPTRGYPDSFTQIGTLVKEGDPNKNDDNKILRLFGRQEYPGSERYEYYTALNSGNDQIKVPIDIRKRELYNDDFVYIKELDQYYRVHLNRFDQPKYYPDLI